MNRIKKAGIMKIAGCIAVYATFVILAFSFKFKNQTILVLLSTFIGSVVVVASYHEYSVTFTKEIDGKKKVRTPVPIQQYEESEHVTPVEIPQEPEEDFIIPAEDGIAEFDMSLISPEVFDEIESMDVDDEMKDEILSIVSGMPEDDRLPYMKRVFHASTTYEEDY